MMTMRADDILNTLTKKELAVFKLRALYTASGYSRYKMSKFEEYDLYAKNKDFLPTEDIITFKDGQRLLALKPDVTLSIIKSCQDRLHGVSKLCYNESVYRPQNGGQFKEITQVGIECLGEVCESEVAEVIGLAGASLAGITDTYALEISSLDIISAMLDRLPLSYQGRKKMLECIADKSEGGIFDVARDEAIPGDRLEPITALISIYGAPAEVSPRLLALKTEGAVGDAIDSFISLLDTLDGGEVGKHLFVDFSALGNMKYYNGVAFKGYIRGIPKCVLSGGQYDRLLARMRKNMRGVGFAFYLDELDMLPE